MDSKRKHTKFIQKQIDANGKFVIWLYQIEYIYHHTLNRFVSQFPWFNFNYNFIRVISISNFSGNCVVVGCNNDLEWIVHALNLRLHSIEMFTLRRKSDSNQNDQPLTMAETISHFRMEMLLLFFLEFNLLDRHRANVVWTPTHTQFNNVVLQGHCSIWFDY